MVEVTTLDNLDEEPHAEAFSERAPRTVRLRLAAGESVPAHSHPGTDVVLHLVSGELDLALDGETHRLSAGDLAQFSGDREVQPEAVEAATAVIVFAPAE